MTDHRLSREEQIKLSERKRENRIAGWTKAMRLNLTKPEPEQVDESEQRLDDLRRQI